MIAQQSGKKWQNLVDGKCILCDSQLERQGAKAFVCSKEGCDFFMMMRTYWDILMDDEHILRQYATPEQLEKINNLTNPIHE